MKSVDIKSKVVKAVLQGFAQKYASDEPFIGSFGELYGKCVDLIPYGYHGIYPANLDEFKELLKAMDPRNPVDTGGEVYIEIHDDTVEIMWIDTYINYKNAIVPNTEPNPNIVRFEVPIVGTKRKRVYFVDSAKADSLLNNRLWVIEDLEKEDIKSVVSRDNNELKYLAQMVAETCGVITDIDNMCFRPAGNPRNYCEFNLVFDKRKLESNMNISVTNQIEMLQGEDISGAMVSYVIQDKNNRRRTRIIKLPNSWNGKFETNEWRLVEDEVVNIRDGELLQYFLTGVNKSDITIRLKEPFFYVRSNYEFIPAKTNEPIQVSSPDPKPVKKVTTPERKAAPTEVKVNTPPSEVKLESNKMAKSPAKPKMATIRKVEAFVIEWDEGKSSTMFMAEPTEVANMKVLIAKCEELGLDIPGLMSGLLNGK